MPTSQETQINEILWLVKKVRPKTILDIGTGFGKYGFLCREYSELPYGRLRKGDWETRIDGIEVFEEYLTPVHEYIYDKIYVGNALEIVDNLEVRYDLVLLIDVLEHLTYDHGIELLDKLVLSGSGVIVSTPKNIGVLGCRQQGVFNNLFEKHRFQWNMKIFRKYGPIFRINNRQSYIVYIRGDAVNLKWTYIKHVLKCRVPLLQKACQLVKRMKKVKPASTRA